MKQKLKLIILAVLVAAVAITLTAGGCGKKTEESTKTEVETKTEKIDENWTTATNKSDLKDEAIGGKINNEDISINNVSIKSWNDEYSWSFSNLAPELTCGVVLNNSAVNFSSKALQAGTFEKKLADKIESSDYHAYYHYEQENGSPMSVNVNWGATVVIEKVNKDTKKVTGWAKFEFADEKTALEGSFEADLCE